MLHCPFCEYIGGTDIFTPAGAHEVGKNEELSELSQLAQAYLEKCPAPFSQEALKETTAAGNKALIAARSVHRSSMKQESSGKEST